MHKQHWCSGHKTANRYRVIMWRKQHHISQAELWCSDWKWWLREWHLNLSFWRECLREYPQSSAVSLVIACYCILEIVKSLGLTKVEACAGILKCLARMEVKTQNDFWLDFPLNSLFSAVQETIVASAWNFYRCASFQNLVFLDGFYHSSRWGLGSRLHDILVPGERNLIHVS